MAALGSETSYLSVVVVMFVIKPELGVLSVTILVNVGVIFCG